MWEMLLWLYVINAMLLIIHEMDSAYWEEWKLFKLPGGIDCFLLVHFPMVLIVLYGLVLVARHSLGGLIYSLLLCLAGIFAFSIHTYFIRQGKEGFTSGVSQLILIGTLVVSLTQVAITVLLLAGV